jgi:isopentenyl-diphosphate Delta-isomerase
VKVLEALAQKLGDRLLVKETGCGLSPRVLRSLAEVGVVNFDVSGLGGTSWVRVEELRQPSNSVGKEVGAQFSGWGIPTAAAVSAGRKALGNRATLVASGGIRNGLDVAKALALGADIAGMALPIFHAHQRGGLSEVRRTFTSVKTALTNAMLLTGSRTVAELRKRPIVMSDALHRWEAALTHDR